MNIWILVGLAPQLLTCWSEAPRPTVAVATRPRTLVNIMMGGVDGGLSKAWRPGLRAWCFQRVFFSRTTAGNIYVLLRSKQADAPNVTHADATAIFFPPSPGPGGRWYPSVDKCSSPPKTQERRDWTEYFPFGSDFRDQGRPRFG